jgi:hypothetical protein
MARSSRHWYVRGPNGEIQEAHHLGIKEARQQKAYISPTTVLQEVRATPYNLDKWKRQQLVAACMDAPAAPQEDPAAYYERVNELSFRRSDTATDFGKRLHAIAEHYPDRQLDDTLNPWYDRFAEWHTMYVQEDLGLEERVMDTYLGVAGTLDRRVILKDGRLAIIDVKTQGIKDRVYIGETWDKQGSVYVNAVRRRDSLPMNPVFINVIVDSTAPNKFLMKEWLPDEINEAYREFIVELWLWSRSTRHWPVSEWSLCDILNNPYLCPGKAA